MLIPPLNVLNLYENFLKDSPEKVHRKLKSIGKVKATFREQVIFHDINWFQLLSFQHKCLFLCREGKTIELDYKFLHSFLIDFDILALKEYWNKFVPKLSPPDWKSVLNLVIC